MVHRPGSGSGGAHSRKQQCGKGQRPGCLRPNARTGSDSAHLPGLTCYPQPLAVADTWGPIEVPGQYQEGVGELRMGLGSEAQQSARPLQAWVLLWRNGTASVRIGSPRGSGSSSRVGNVSQFLYYVHKKFGSCNI